MFNSSPTEIEIQCSGLGTRGSSLIVGNTKGSVRCTNVRQVLLTLKMYFYWVGDGVSTLGKVEAGTIFGSNGGCGGFFVTEDAAFNCNYVQLDSKFSERLWRGSG